MRHYQARLTYVFSQQTYSIVQVITHIEGKTHKKNLNSMATSPQDPGFNEQYVRQFFDTDSSEVSWGTIGKDDAPAHWSDDMRCEICDTFVASWGTWHSHFIGKKHLKARRNCDKKLFWQELFAEMPYYYEHISGMWQVDKPRKGIEQKGGKVIIVP